MMRSKWMRDLLRALISLLGAGIGVALMLAVVQIIHMANPDMKIPIQVLVAGYAGTSLTGLLLFFLLSRRILAWFDETVSSGEKQADRLTLPQLISRAVGLIIGLVIASLLSNVLRFMGDSLFTTILCMILFVILGTIGYTMGRKRSGEVEELTRRATLKGHRYRRKDKKRMKLRSQSEHPLLLDTSVLIDGRILQVVKLGFLQGSIMVPACVVEELRRVADSADPLRRARGRRGLDVLDQLTALRQDITIQEDTAGDEEADVQLMRMARRMGAAVVTDDFNLSRAARLTGLRVLNLNELAGALRPTVQAGDELQVLIVKEGKESGQGVGYMSDGTMIVVDGGKLHMNETIAVTVTSALQTNAGRMVFAKAA